MMIRLLALGLNLPADTDHGALELAKDLWDTDEPALWQRDLTGAVTHWIDVGQPDDKRLMRAAGRADRVSVYSFSASTPIWWNSLATKITRASNIAVWQVEAAQSQALAALAQRGMQLQFTVQDGAAWIGDGIRSVEIVPQRLNPG
jgi:uncharacterized protein YaeQ